jgi:nucleoside-diphosphate-sugar epimerase
MISKNILITGASGYVGSRLSNQLIKNKFRNIINYDISLYGDDHLSKFKNYIYITIWGLDVIVYIYNFSI